jgi:hypothetical protein
VAEATHESTANGVWVALATEGGDRVLGEVWCRVTAPDGTWATQVARATVEDPDVFSLLYPDDFLEGDDRDAWMAPGTHPVQWFAEMNQATGEVARPLAEDAFELE